MSYFRNQLLEIDDCLYNFNVFNLYKASIELFRTLKYPIVELEEDLSNLSFEKSLVRFGQGIDFVNPSEILATACIETVSVLFVLNNDTYGLEHVEKFNDGLFVGESIIVLGVELQEIENDYYEVPIITNVFNRLFNTQVLMIFKKGSKIAFSVKRRRVNKKDETVDAKGSNFQTDWLETYPPKSDVKYKLIELSFDNFRENNFYYMYSDIVKTIAEEYLIEDFPKNDIITSHLNIMDGVALYFRDIENLPFHYYSTNQESNNLETFEIQDGSETDVSTYDEVASAFELVMDSNKKINENRTTTTLGGALKMDERFNNSDEKLNGLEDLLVLVKEKFPNRAIDLSESLELLKETINDTMTSINNEVSQAYLNRKFNIVRELAQLGEDINEYEKKIEKLIEVLEVDNIIESIDGEENEEEERTLPTDYSDYYVDTNVEHTLYENFTHKRPFAFRINDNNIIEVKTWQEMLIKTCELLIAIDESKFYSFENKPSMNGKKCKYFAINESDIRKPKLVSGKIFVETNISGNGVRNLILKMLKEYGFKSNEYKVYLRADYTERYN